VWTESSSARIPSSTSTKSASAKKASLSALTDGQHVRPLLVDALRRRERQLPLAPARFDRVRRDDGDQEVPVGDLLRDLLDKRIADLQNDLVVADVEALRLQTRGEIDH
jgi:hypothetical protein